MKADELDEGKRKRNRKARRALYGPGPYGMYGTDAGYSGDGGVAEDITPEKSDRIKEFVKFCFKKLQLKKRPRIRLSNRVETTALGYFVPDTNTIVVVVKGRHGMDIMRTLAHELVHLKQSETRALDGSTGSPDENEANAMAGVLLRVWGKLHPEYFVETRKFTDLELAIMEGGGSIDDNHTYAIRKQLAQAWKEKQMKVNEILEEGIVKDIKRLATGKDVKSRAGQEIAKSQDASMKGDTKTSKKHFDRYDKFDKLANKEKNVDESATAGATSAANVGIGIAYNNKPAAQPKGGKKTKHGKLAPNALDMKGPIVTGGSIGKQSFIKR
jgi:hypothetical protein